ncbi:MAG: hypothetical protein ACRDS9_09650, partial [Pseudonocardiaceae bacterium]
SNAAGGAGGAGGTANVDPDQTTTVVNDLDFTNSFNEDNDTNSYTNSFNQDNDGIDNAGGEINDSVVAGRDITNSLNSDDDNVLVNSFNQDNDETNVDISDDDFTVTDIDDSFNQDNDFLDLDILNGIDI